MQSANPSLSNIAINFACNFGYFGAISLYCRISTQITQYSLLFSITPETNMLGAKGYITLYIPEFSETIMLGMNSNGINLDSVPLTRLNTAYCIYGVWYRIV